MRIIIGGSSSTGSSLIQATLNKHSKVYCGPETSLFAKSKLFDDWGMYKYRILNKGFHALRNPSWFLLNGVHLIDESRLWNKAKLKKIIDSSSSFQQFSDAYFKAYLEFFNKQIWIEKTPTNVFNFKRFLDSFEQSKVLHTIRNPYDTISSLINRGYSPYFACGLYLCNTSAGLNSRGSKRYFEIKYESLVSDPHKLIKELTDFIEIPFENEMLLNNSGNSLTENKIETWKYSADDMIRKGNTETFSSQSKSVQEEIKVLAKAMVLRGEHRQDQNSIREICELLDYPFLETSAKLRMDHYFKRWTDILERTRRTYPTHLFNYPISLNR